MSETDDLPDRNAPAETEYRLGDLVSENHVDDVIWEIVEIRTFEETCDDGQPWFRRFYLCRFRWTDDWEQLDTILEEAEGTFMAHLDMEATKFQAREIHAAFMDRDFESVSHIVALALADDDDPKRYAEKVDDAFKKLRKRRPLSYEVGDLIQCDGGGMKEMVWRVAGPCDPETRYPLEFYGHTMQPGPSADQMLLMMGAVPPRKRNSGASRMTPAPQDMIDEIDKRNADRMGMCLNTA